MKVRTPWLRWAITICLIVAFGFFRRWDWLSFILLGAYIFIGGFFVVAALVRPRMGRKLARMTPEERDRFFAGYSPEERRIVEERAKDYVG